MPWLLAVLLDSFLLTDVCIFLLVLALLSESGIRVKQTFLIPQYTALRPHAPLTSCDCLPDRESMRRRLRAGLQRKLHAPSVRREYQLARLDLSPSYEGA